MHVPILRLEYSEEDIQFIKNDIEKVLRSGYLTMSTKVEAFEKAFAEFCGVKYAIGTNSGTSSLEMVLRIINVENKIVVMPSNTYMATPIAAIKAGAKVRFTDCEKENLQMSPEDLEKIFCKDTAAVIIVHIGGIISPRFKEISDLCKKKGIPLIEDAAHAHGATFNGIKAGSLGKAASFSFYPTKVLTTAEGGMLTTNDPVFYEKAKILREHGKKESKFNIHTEIGDNWRFSEIHAVLGLQQMKRVDSILSERRRLAELYDQELMKINEIDRLIIPSNTSSAYYKYIVFLQEGIDREVLKQKLKTEFNVELTGEVYSDPCHSQPVFKKYPHLIANNKNDEFPNTDQICASHICLPLYPGLKNAEVKYVVSSLNNVLNYHN